MTRAAGRRPGRYRVLRTAGAPGVRCSAGGRDAWRSSTRSGRARPAHPGPAAATRARDGRGTATDVDRVGEHRHPVRRSRHLDPPTDAPSPEDPPGRTAKSSRPAPRGADRAFDRDVGVGRLRGERVRGQATPCRRLAGRSGRRSELLGERPRRRSASDRPSATRSTTAATAWPSYRRPPPGRAPPSAKTLYDSTRSAHSPPTTRSRSPATPRRQIRAIHRGQRSRPFECMTSARRMVLSWKD